MSLQGRKDEVPSTGGARDLMASLNGLGTVSATVSLQTLLTELSPDQDFPPCCHLLSLCPPHCHPPHSTALLSLGLCAPCATSYHSPGCTVPTATSLGTGVVPCPVPPPPRETPAASPASPVSLPSLVTEPALPSVPPAHGAGSEHPAVTSHAGAQAGYTPLTPPPAAQPAHTHAALAAHPAFNRGLLFFLKLKWLKLLILRSQIPHDALTPCHHPMSPAETCQEPPHLPVFPVVPSATSPMPQHSAQPTPTPSCAPPAPPGIPVMLTSCCALTQPVSQQIQGSTAPQ